MYPSIFFNFFRVFPLRITCNKYFCFPFGLARNINERTMSKPTKSDTQSRIEKLGTLSLWVLRLRKLSLGNQWNWANVENDERKEMKLSTDCKILYALKKMNKNHENNQKNHLMHIFISDVWLEQNVLLYVNLYTKITVKIEDVLSCPASYSMALRMGSAVKGQCKRENYVLESSQPHFTLHTLLCKTLEQKCRGF